MAISELQQAPDSGAGQSTIDCDDPAIHYSPGNWAPGAGGVMQSINPGAYLRALLAHEQGVRSLRLHFDVSELREPLPQIYVRVDGGPWQLGPVTEQVKIKLAGSERWPAHLLELVFKSATERRNRWPAPSRTALRFRAISADHGKLLRCLPVVGKPLRGLVFGDSITEGIKTVSDDATLDVSNNDAMLGWAYQLGETLGAEVGVIGFGRQGLARRGRGKVPPFPETVGIHFGAGPARDFAGLDFIVINQGTNDAKLGAERFTTLYAQVVGELLARTEPGCQIVCLRPFRGDHAAQIEAAVARCAAPERCHYVDTSGWWDSADSSDAVHPYGYANVAQLSRYAARAVAAALRGGTVAVGEADVADVAEADGEMAAVGAPAVVATPPAHTPAATVPAPPLASGRAAASMAEQHRLYQAQLEENRRLHTEHDGNLEATEMLARADHDLELAEQLLQAVWQEQQAAG